MTLRFIPIKTVKKAVKVKFRTKEGKTVHFRALKTVAKKQEHP